MSILALHQKGWLVFSVVSYFMTHHMFLEKMSVSVVLDTVQYGAL